ncbi:MAG: hypothetical protein EKK41_01330 [Hyphomicrobiales bacterium]|nr:MAG: hypothetical protein EKK41_01330 [Hyphomicrobiales bacterium]
MALAHAGGMRDTHVATADMNPAIHYILLACGGAMIAASLGVLARLNLYYLMGLVPLFPTFALMAHVLAAASGNDTGLRMAAAFGLYALLPYACYLGSILWLSHAMPPLASIAVGLCAWFVTAFALIWAWNAGWLPGRVV